MPSSEREKQLTVEKELPRHITFAIGARFGEVRLGLIVGDGLLIEAIAAEFWNSRYANGAEVLVLDEELTAGKYITQPIHGDIVGTRQVVLALYREHVHDVLLAAELVLQLLAVDLEEGLLLRLRRHLMLLLLLLLLLGLGHLLSIEELAGEPVAGLLPSVVGRSVSDFVGDRGVLVAARVA